MFSVVRNTRMESIKKEHCGQLIMVLDLYALKASDPVGPQSLTETPVPWSNT